MSNYSKTTLVAATVVVLALVAAGSYWLGTTRSRSDPAAASSVPAGPAKAVGGGPPVTVEATRVVMASMPQAITAVGSLRSDESVMVRPEVAGRISAIQFQEGQRVTKGQVLVKLDPSINDAEVRQAHANLKLAQTKFDRAVELAKTNFISSQARDEAENNLRVSEAALALVEARLSKTEIKAPFGGVIGLRVVSVGDYVKEGQDIVNLESIDPLKVDFRVPETYMRQVEVGQVLTVTLDAFPGKTFEGRVLAVNPLVDQAGRSIVIRAIVRNPDIKIRPGMFARVRLITQVEQQALVIPEQAIVPQGDEQYVFRVVDGKAARAKVDVGQRREGKVEVRKGVAANDVVVTAGQLKLRDGQPVTIAESRTNDASAIKPASAEPVKPEPAAPAPKS
jgi:membrane fusion protein (multidrug efflux system)